MSGHPISGIQIILSFHTLSDRFSIALAYNHNPISLLVSNIRALKLKRRRMP